MTRYTSGFLFFLTLTLAIATAPRAAAQATWPTPQEGDFVVHDFHFQSGETLPEVRIHYTTLGKPMKDASGHTTNAVLILHGTGGRSARTHRCPHT